MIRVNFLQPQIFKHRFGREPKNWTIEQLHDLWLRTCERSNKRRKEYCDCVDAIAKEIPKNEKGEVIVYYKHKGRKNLSQYKLSYNRDWKSWSVSRDSVSLKTREDRLSFLLHSTTKVYEMGQKLFELDSLYMSTNSSYKVREIMWRQVEESLRQRFKDEPYKHYNKIFVLSISDKKYFVEIDDRTAPRYYKFSLQNEFNDEVISL